MDSGETKDGVGSEAAEVETTVEQQGDGQEKDESGAPQEVPEAGDQPSQGEQNVDREHGDDQTTSQSEDVQTTQEKQEEPKDKVQTGDDQNQQDGEREESPKEEQQQQQQQQEQSQAENETGDVLPSETVEEKVATSTGDQSPKEQVEQSQPVESVAGPTDSQPAEPQPEQEASSSTKEANEEGKAKVEGQDTPSSDERQSAQDSSVERKEATLTSSAETMSRGSKGDIPSKTDVRRPRTQEREDRRPTTQQSMTSLRGESRKEKRKRDRKTKRRSTGEVVPPKLKKKSRGSRQSIASTGETIKHLEVYILSLFQTYDPQRSGYVDQTIFWQVLESSLNLSPSELTGLQTLIFPKKAGLISYEDFAHQATDIIASLYHGLPASDEYWVELKAYDGSMVVNYNKQTGEIKDLVESGADLFEGVISEMFQLADIGQKGFVSKDEFTNMLQSSEMLSYLQREDIIQMQQYFDSIPGSRATYADFYPIAKEIILRVYRVKDPSESEWCQLNSPQVGIFWFNKYTGEARRIPADDREQEIDFLTKTYNQMEGLQVELEQCKKRNRELENTLAQANEEQEALAAQLYETGHALDETNNEVQRKENELEHMRGVVSSKEQEITSLRELVAELQRLQDKLIHSEQELQSARKTIEARDNSISERDTNISDLRKETDVISEKLKTAHGVIDAKESSIETLQSDLQSKQKQVKEFEKQVPELETKVASTEEHLEQTQHSLEEKTTALSHCRKLLKNSKEKNMDLEKEVEKLNMTREKLHNAESEIRTLKSFLTTKTAIVEKRKKELRETKVKMSELEEKDARRAVILADVLEKTARQYQQQLKTQPHSRRGRVSPVKEQTTQPRNETPELRSASAPAIPPEGEQTDDETTHRRSRRVVLKSYTLDGPLADELVGGTHTAGHHTGVGASKPSKQKARSRTVPKLPPIRQARPMQRTRTFAVPTAHDIKKYYKSQDTAVIEHASSNPQCNCELCRMNSTVMGPSSLRPETGMTSKSAGVGYQGETDVREIALARQLQIGQRVLVQVKKSEFDLEPQQLTGMIKFVGKIDSEYIDNRIYVGVKLDEAVGNTDGLIKGKRYFTCPPKHGKLVRITSIVAILPNKSVCYRPLQKITKRSPYTTVQKKVKIS